jgi:hypothetical protein
MTNEEEILYVVVPKKYKKEVISNFKCYRLLHGTVKPYSIQNGEIFYALIEDEEE